MIKYNSETYLIDYIERVLMPQEDLKICSCYSQNEALKVDSATFNYVTFKTKFNQPTFETQKS